MKYDRDRIVGAKVKCERCSWDHLIKWFLFRGIVWFAIYITYFVCAGCIEF